VETDGIQEALLAELHHAAGLPRTKANVTVELEDDTGFTVYNATVESWSGGQVEQLARLGTVIRGGRLVVTDSLTLGGSMLTLGGGTLTLSS
jgi:hypothetical protein